MNVLKCYNLLKKIEKLENLHGYSLALMFVALFFSVIYNLYGQGYLPVINFWSILGFFLTLGSLVTYVFALNENRKLVENLKNYIKNKRR